MATPQEEAAQHFDAAIRELLTPNHALKPILQRCQLACHLVGWNEWRDWFWKEIAGYPAGSEIPSYRRVPASLTWTAKGGMDLRLKAAIHKVTRVGDTEDEPTTVALWQGIDVLIPLSTSGMPIPTGETKESSLDRETVTLERVKVVQAATLLAVVRYIENTTYNLATQGYSVLQYGNALTDIWTSYRLQVDAALQRLGMTQHLDTIQANLRANTAEAGRVAVGECRNLLEDLARYLWQDPREFYEYLKNQKGEPFRVTQKEFSNRLSAYIHQKGLSGSEGDYLRDEVQRLGTTIRSLIALEGKAHSPVDVALARSVALGTYFIVGELALRTDLTPVTKYTNPATPEQGSAQTNTAPTERSG